ncbi:MBL fold metallo-hydrolase [Rhodobacteraceae bacterium B1Z28]|uniref:MBL fold metallo-hydrolase n=1 Tax=Ruegeria haliotis TaxID=2747601 RepID=A0ABX2PQE5_9RHOB|nr:alkyl sulfatase dimerization domain-containing protein [Ruegeria haliotis]NVO56333.1 MBL fold metallo-hydrolase [Ruegeria haliotis]
MARRHISLVATAFLGLTAGLAAAENQGSEHFDPKGKLPSQFTIDFQNQMRESLPFDDLRDFEESRKGLIATPDYKQITTEDGTVAWDIGSYEYLLKEGEEFDSIHPSLQRQAILNMNFGLYEIQEGTIYQVRGFDLSNITFIRGDTGWIIFDPLASKETAAAALKLLTDTVGERPVKAVVYSHSHADHYGGVRGVISDEDVANGVEVIAPEGFMEHAVSENVYAGNVMNRRLFFQYGVLLPRSPFGHVDQSIGKNISAGTTGLIEPTRYVSDAYEEITIDGVRMIFQNTPGTEAPAEMNTYFPDLKAFWAAENITGTIHNIYTLRGALVRDALMWSKHINDALYEFGQDAEVMFASHSWPRFGNDRIQEVMRAQRDTYANLNNGVLNLANKGVTVNQVHNVYEVPESLQQQWAARSYHGSVEHNSRAVINRYLGYWDANPTTLTPLSPEDSAPLFVEMMGGAEPILTKGQELVDSGKYLEATEILNKLVYAEPQNQTAKDLLADAFEQIGYQKESPSVRNSFLGAAFELRNGIPQGATIETTGPDTIKAMQTSMWLDFIAIRVNSAKAADMEFTINLAIPDRDENIVVEMSNATLTHIVGQNAENADLSISLNRADLEQVMTGERKLTEMLADGTAKSEGNADIVTQLASTLDQFDIGFELMPGTGAQDLTPAANDFAQPPLANSNGG